MLARECAPENAGVAGYAEAFRCVLSGKQASIQSRYLRTAILEQYCKKDCKITDQKVAGYFAE